jgi:hypothetical protein
LIGDHGWFRAISFKKNSSKSFLKLSLRVAIFTPFLS